MTLIIDHRRNAVEQIQQTDPRFGAEIDIRIVDGTLRVVHDPFTQGPKLDDWLASYKHKFLIANVKEEGLESAVEELLANHGISDYFFLDQSFPYLVKTSSSGNKRCAVRVSEYETPKTALSLAGMIDWAWVDCFTKMPLNKAQSELLRAAGFKLCFVSPELQGRQLDLPFIKSVFALGKPDAICTKHPELWEKALARKSFAGKTAAELGKALLGSLSPHKDE